MRQVSQERIQWTSKWVDPGGKRNIDQCWVPDALGRDAEPTTVGISMRRGLMHARRRRAVAGHLCQPLVIDEASIINSIPPRALLILACSRG
jgi:hypothetical protein